MKEACGVFGVYAPGKRVANLTFDGLFALQHRGQESAGMAVSDGDTVTVVKDMGLVATVFDERTLSGLEGHLAIGHTRYSTHGSSDWAGAQPVYRPVGRAGFALGHNGNLTNTAALAEKVGMLPGSIATDSDVVAELLAASFPETEDLATALRAVLPILEGAFSFVLMSSERLFGVRDPLGFRPLCLGRLGPADAPEGWVLASETPALSVIGATFVREVAPGEMVVIDADGPTSLEVPWLREVTPRLCIFEFAYIARPDSRLYGREVHETRCRMGELLAAQAPADADMVMGVPESGVPAAEGFARASGIPYGQGLVKNRYIGRSFIAPDQGKRDAAVRRKLNPLPDAVAGKRLVVVDDSIVRGTTQRSVIRMLREAGAAEVHLRISSPPWRWPCFYGIDTPSYEELLATDHSIEDMARILGADSLAYISIENLKRAIGADAGFCDACFTGDYPTPVPVAVSPSRSAGPSRSRPWPTRPRCPESDRRGPGRRHLRRRRGGHRGRRRRGRTPAVHGGGIGGFGGQFPLDTGGTAQPVLVASTDGVGTKLVVARGDRPLRHRRHRPGRHVRRRPRVRRRRAAVHARLRGHRQGRPRAQVATVVAGVHEGCRQAGCALLGGETAEHPGVMAPDELDLAGFAVGVVEQGAQLGPARVRAGDVVVGLPSPGLRSNGYTLARHVLLERAGLDLGDPAWDGAGHSVADELLRPSVIYAPAVLAAREAGGGWLHACAHITGGGIVGNLPRVLPEGLGAVLDRSTWAEPRIFAEIQRLGAVAEGEMDRVFNRGIGMALVADPQGVDALLNALDAAGRPSAVVGEIAEGVQGVRFT